MIQCSARIALLAGPLLWGATPNPVGAPAPPAEVVLEALDGSLRRVELAGFSARSPGAVDTALVRFVGVPPIGPAQGEVGRALIELANGDQLWGRIAGGAGEALMVELVGRVVLPIPIDDLRSLRVPERIPEDPGTALEAPEEGDRVYQRTGASLDPIDGAVEEFRADGLQFDSLRLGSKSIPWAEVAALFVEVLGEPEGREGVGDPVVVDLVDGGRLRGSCQGIDGSGCRLRVGSSLLILPLGVVAEIAVDDGSLAFLSDLPPDEAEEGSPFGDDLGMTWPHRMDRSVRGGALRAGGRTYARGIGVHAPSRLVWHLGGEWSSMRGSCAIDDEVLVEPARGSVVFRVWVDGVRAWESGVVRGGDAPVSLAGVDLAGADELVLEVDMAGEFFVADRADWLRVLLVR